jgi:hypothetical protein
MEAVAVLFARADSHYKAMPGCDVWDAERDARRWPGGRSVVTHPPCGMWGRYAHRCKGGSGEKALAVWAVQQVRAFGGVLEHPATSRLWPELGLPEPGARDAWGGWTLVVYQSWWGHRAPKPTRLYIVGCSPADLPAYPFALGIPPGRIENMNVREREATTPAFAQWLVDLARRCAPCLH